jgi:hypothetical protein
MKRTFLYLGLVCGVFALSSCAEMARDMDIDGATDVQLRSGLRGTQKDPAELDPFKRYDLVMAANECRVFTMKVPTNWYWKVYITAAARKENVESRVSATIEPSSPAWSSLPGTTFEKIMTLRQDGVQAVLAVGNANESREAELQICQEGAPANITIESQVSSTASLIGPDDDSTNHTFGRKSDLLKNDN